MQRTLGGHEPTGEMHSPPKLATVPNAGMVARLNLYRFIAARQFGQAVPCASSRIMRDPSLFALMILPIGNGNQSDGRACPMPGPLCANAAAFWATDCRVSATDAFCASFALDYNQDCSNHRNDAVRDLPKRSRADANLILPHRIRLRIFLLLWALLGVASEPVALATETLDIDANNSTTTMTDGVLVIRYMFGLRGAALVAGAVGGSPWRNTAEIESYLAGLTTGAMALDIDGKGTVDALTDGLMIVRYLIGLRGTALTQNAIGPGMGGRNAAEIETYLGTLTSSTPQVPTGCYVTAMPTATIGSPVAPGTVVQLYANCTSQLGVRYTWNVGVSTPTILVAPSTTATYSFIASNSAGSGPPASYTIYVSGPVNYCQGADKELDVPWPSGGQTRPGTTAFSQQVYTFRLQIPLNPVPFDPNKKGFVKTAEIAGYPNTFRELTVSKSKCDFHAPSGGYMFDTLGNVGDPGPGFSFMVNHPNDYMLYNAQVNFQPGDVIYVSVRNSFVNNMGMQTPSCPLGTSCEMYFDYQVPN